MLLFFEFSDIFIFSIKYFNCYFFLQLLFVTKNLFFLYILSFYPFSKQISSLQSLFHNFSFLAHRFNLPSESKNSFLLPLLCQYFLLFLSNHYLVGYLFLA